MAEPLNPHVGGTTSKGKRPTIGAGTEIVIDKKLDWVTPKGAEIELPEEVWRSINEAQRLLKAMQPLAQELAKTFGALRGLFEGASLDHATAALQSLNQTLATAKDLFVAIDQVDEQRLVTLVAAFEKLADELARLPAELEQPGATPRAAPPAATLPPLHADLPRPAPFPPPPPAKPAFRLPPPPVPPIKPDWLKEIEPIIDEERLPRTGRIDELIGGVGRDRLGLEAFAQLREMDERRQRAKNILTEWEEFVRPLQSTVFSVMRPLSSPEVAQAKGALDELGKRLDELDFDWRTTFGRMTGVLVDFAETGEFKWRELAKIALDSIQDMLEGWLDLQRQKTGGGDGERDPWSIILSSAGGALGDLFGASGSGGATLPAGGVHGPTLGIVPKAAGGPVSAFEPFLVGEAGPELFIPRLPGAIVPNHALGPRRGADQPPLVIHQHLNVMPGVPEAVRREVAAMLPQIANAARGAVMSDLDRNSAIRRRIS